MLTAFRAHTVAALRGESCARSQAELDAPVALLRDAVLLVKNGFVHDVLPYAAYKNGKYKAVFSDLGDVCLTPGLINAHCHLELSHLAGKTVSGRGFGVWMRSLVSQVSAPVGEDALRAAIEKAVSLLFASGVSHVADICSRRPDLVLEQALRAMAVSGLPLYPVTHLFEAFGFDHPESGPGDDGAAAFFSGASVYAPKAAAFLPEARRTHAALAGHALYSTSPTAMRAAKGWCVANGRPFSMHLAESVEEESCLCEGKGLLHDLLRVRVLPRGWTPPRLRPVPYAARLGLLGKGTLAVHCVHCDARDMALLAESGSTLCLCPRSNEYIGVGTAPAFKYMEKELPLCLGTDGLSSNTDLDMRLEMQAARHIYGFSSRAVLRMATVNGAGILSLGALGTLEPGKSARFAVFGKEFARELR